MFIHIINLDINMIEADLQRAFMPYGEIHEIKIERDLRTNRSRGKATIEMPVEKQARNAQQHLDGSLMGKKKISLSLQTQEEQYRFRL